MAAGAETPATSIWDPRAGYAVHAEIWSGKRPGIIRSMLLGLFQRSASRNLGIDQEPRVPEFVQRVPVAETRVPDLLVHGLGVARDENGLVLENLPPSEREGALSCFSYDQGRDAESQGLSVDGLK